MVYNKTSYKIFLNIIKFFFPFLLVFKLLITNYSKIKLFHFISEICMFNFCSSEIQEKTKNIEREWATGQS